MCSAFLLAFALALTQVGRLRQLAWRRNGFRPGFGQQLTARQDFCREERSHQGEASAYDATQAALRRLAHRSLAPPTRDMLCWQGLAQIALALFVFRQAADACRPDLGYSHLQPQPLDTAGVLHFAVMPAPQAAFKVFETALNPRSHAIPTHLSLFWR